MAIHCICVVKNEADIVGQTLTAAARWADFIYVYDTGSTDGTWEKVLALARDVPVIVPFRQEDRPFGEPVRAVPFHHYRDRSSPGDWWCKLDADELYIDEPRAFLASVPEAFDAVWGAYFQYYLTEKDVIRFEEHPELYDDDVPVEAKCRYYLCNWSEIKLFRYAAHLDWVGALPHPLRRSFPRRIRFKHFQYRSPRQIETRLVVRRPAMNTSFTHELRGSDWAPATVEATGAGAASGPSGSWLERVADSSRLIYDTGSNYVVTEELLPPIIDPNPSGYRRVTDRLQRIVGSRRR